MALKRKLLLAAALVSHCSAEASTRAHHIKLLSTKSDGADDAIGQQLCLTF
jgi:hypothetical protein